MLNNLQIKFLLDKLAANAEHAAVVSLIDAAARVAATPAVTGNCYTLYENLNDDLDLKRIIVHVIYYVVVGFGCAAIRNIGAAGTSSIRSPPSSSSAAAVLRFFTGR